MIRVSVCPTSNQVVGGSTAPRSGDERPKGGPQGRGAQGRVIRPGALVYQALAMPKSRSPGAIGSHENFGPEMPEFPEKRNMPILRRYPKNQNCVRRPYSMVR